MDGSFNPFLWVSNVEWYTQEPGNRRKKPPGRFVVLDDPAFKLSREGAVRILGEPAKKVRFQNTRILIYNGNVRNAAPSPAAGDVRDDQPFTTFSEQITSPVRLLSLHPGETTSLPLSITEYQRRLLGERGEIPGHAEL